MSRAEKPIDEKCDAAIGLVGVGLLGNALASRLILAGFPVTGWDVNADARRGLEELGGTVASGVVDAMSCPRVFLSLPH
ncbi:MAG: NAD(P)-binding domain-containing protein, partial [Planctomycetaceae bacterium]|nr:NAD(P)-binding domain-containing protein [Planctomycetaceae bacterium]